MSLRNRGDTSFSEVILKDAYFMAQSLFLEFSFMHHGMVEPPSGPFHDIKVWGSGYNNFRKKFMFNRHFVHYHE